MSGNGHAPHFWANLKSLGETAPDQVRTWPCNFKTAKHCRGMFRNPDAPLFQDEKLEMT
jgi:hypothetical protein